MYVFLYEMVPKKPSLYGRENQCLTMYNIHNTCTYFNRNVITISEFTRIC